MTDKSHSGLTFSRKDVSTLWKDAAIRGFEAGALVVDRDDATLDVFILLSGRLRVSLLTLQGRELVMRDLQVGEVLGEIACFERKPRSARIIAVTRAEVATIPAASFRGTILSSPVLAEKLFIFLAARQRELSERLLEISALSVLGRLCRDLLRWSMPRVDHPAEQVISPPPTNNDIASRIGCRPEQVSRELNKLMRAGAVKRSKGALVIVDQAHLESLYDQGVNPISAAQ